MSDTKRRILVIIVLFLIVLFGVGQFFAFSNLNSNSSTPSGSNQNPLATQVISYVPETPTTSTPVVAGTCFANSAAAPYRSDAWRCTVGNQISDPCFEIPGVTGSLYCGANPTTTDTSSTFVLKLAKALPKPDVIASTTNAAWLVELNDGTTCRPFTGTLPFSATGDVAHYACDGGATGEDMIFGDLNNASATWTAEVGTLSNETSTYPPPIAVSGTLPIFAVWQ